MRVIPSQPFNPEDVKAFLREGPSKVTFVKKDGSERCMYCTLEEGIISDKIIGTGAARPAHQIPVWDLQKNSWRSFVIASLLSIEPAPAIIPPLESEGEI